MNPVLKGIVRFFDVLYEVSVAFARILLIAMLVIISANVFMRYVLNSGISWSEEIALVLVGWFVFIGLPMGVRKKLHISLHLWRRSIPKLDMVLVRISALAVITLGVILFVYGNRLIGFAARSIMPVTELPSSLLYIILPLSSILLIYEGLTDLLGYETDREAEEVE
jgi:TRAP-type C4-dicarboxylate transport system permease small subunit